MITDILTFTRRVLLGFSPTPTLSNGPKEPPKDQLTVVDSRTKRSYQIPIIHNSVQAIDFRRISTLGFGSSVAEHSAKGLQILDPGFRNTAVIKSQVTYVDGIRGRIQYRRYPIQQLYTKNSYDEVAYLLIWGHLPSVEEKAGFRRSFAKNSLPPQTVINAIKAFPKNSPAFLVVIAGLAAWAGSDPSTVPSFAGKMLYNSNDPDVLNKAVIRTFAALVVVTALVHCHQQNIAFTPPNPASSIVENMLLMMGFVNKHTKRPDPMTVSTLDRLWILYADHEMTNSTAAFLHTASTLADPISASIAGVASSGGPLHGGAIDLAYKTFEDIGTKENVSKLIANVKAKKLRLFGVGHRIYKTEDPRAGFLKILMKELGERTADNPLLAVAMEIDRVVASDSYFTSRNLKVNADLYGCFVYSALGFDPKIIASIMTIARAPGVLAHWKESLEQPPSLWRPQQIFTGEIAK